MGSSAQFRHLLSPVRIGKMELKNRIVMSAMGSRLGSNGYVTEQMKDYYEERARGGVGLVITESTAVAPAALSSLENLWSREEKYFPGLSELARTIQSHGAKVAMQLHHTGPTGRAAILGTQPVAASAVSNPEAWVEEYGSYPRRFQHCS